MPFFFFFFGGGKIRFSFLGNAQIFVVVVGNTIELIEKKGGGHEWSESPMWTMAYDSLHMCRLASIKKFVCYEADIIRILNLPI